ncbi:ras-related protein Rab-20-like [Scleropages formosus]|uniref:Ras-related protein Rab-20 n=1 Tax=Scleropages formosus TaxID=113540 RepID=A0A0P7UPU5_SCLFO|nr:ras-related protein Rab-20 [Scleropages formosus]KPP61524.1 ras-related protein Rab-20-like [Scleropages formosus]
MPPYAKTKKPDVKLVILGDMNVGKTSLLHRYMERRFTDTISTVGGAFFLKQWGPYNISIWDTAGREQFHGLGSMYCRGAAAVLLTYDVTNWQSLAELENRFLSLTDTANSDCIFAIVGNKADLADPKALVVEQEPEEEGSSLPCPTPPASPIAHKQVHKEDAMALYNRILRYKMLDEHISFPAEKMCFETSAKTGYNVDLLFETLFDMVLPSIMKNRSERSSPTVDLEEPLDVKRTKTGCCV